MILNLFTKEKTMNKRNFLLPFLTTALLWIPSQSFSGENQGAHRMWNDLQLNADQQSKLLTIHNESQAIRKAQMDEESTVRGKIKEELAKSNPSKTVLSGFANELGNLHEKQIQSHIDHMLQLKAILTPEQFQKVIDKQWNGQEKGMRGMGRMGGHDTTGGCNAKDAKDCSKDCPAKGAAGNTMTQSCEKDGSPACHRTSPQM
jgi:Spy/CpxP family protein refolding chaperone